MMLNPQHWVPITPRIKELLHMGIHKVGSKRYLGRRLGSLAQHPEHLINDMLKGGQTHIHIKRYAKLLRILGLPEQWGLHEPISIKKGYI